MRTMILVAAILLSACSQTSLTVLPNGEITAVAVSSQDLATIVSDVNEAMKKACMPGGLKMPANGQTTDPAKELEKMTAKELEKLISSLLGGAAQQALKQHAIEKLLDGWLPRQNITLRGRCVEKKKHGGLGPPPWFIDLI